MKCARLIDGRDCPIGFWRQQSVLAGHALAPFSPPGSQSDEAAHAHARVLALGHEVNLFCRFQSAQTFFSPPQREFEITTYAKMEGKMTWFRCRQCGWATRALYYGQWYTKFPVCEKCGLEKGRVDTLADPVLLLIRGSCNVDTYVPMSNTPYGSSRYGAGCEEMTYEQCRNPLGPWRMANHGPQLALFRCRTCGYEKKATYKGQWKTIFPVCEGECGADNGRVDCVDWWGENSTEYLPYRSSRYGPGTESYLLHLEYEIWSEYFAWYLPLWDPNTPGVIPDFQS